VVFHDRPEVIGTMPSGLFASAKKPLMLTLNDNEPYKNKKGE